MRLRERPNEAVEQIVVEVSYPPVHPLHSGVWQLCHSLADIGLLVLLATVFLALIAHHSSLGSTVASWVPGPLRSLFHSQEVEAGDWGHARLRVLPAANEQDATLAGARRASGHPGSAFFAVGSTKELVRGVQGLPTEAGDNVWRYGKSEVRFANGRVVNWRSDPANPLRAR